jgi:glycosyltransferase involved in cell wall biosynthesis
MKISGYICVRNGVELDYCFQLAIASMLPVCDELVVCDSDSTDGTTEILTEWEAREPKLRTINRPWGSPVRHITWWTEWLNYTRERLEFPIQLQIDADEVLDPDSYPAVLSAAKAGEPRWFQRLNFWRDAQHLAPSGHVCGDHVVRLGPSNLWMPSDEPHPEGEPELRARAGWPPNGDRSMRIFHYGFLRKEQALIDKVRVVNGAFFGTMDSRLEKAEKAGSPWVDEVEFTEMHEGVLVKRELQTFEEPHPALAHQWLTDRGYKI